MTLFFDSFAISIVLFLTGWSFVYLLLKDSKSDYLRLFLFPKSIDPENEFGRFFSWIVSAGFILGGGFGIAISIYRMF
jgi:hypothetical protein